MWCATCRADVAAELSSDNRRMLCARCHSELGIAAAAFTTAQKPAGTEAVEREARELLSRWSAQNLLEPPLPPSTSFVELEQSKESIGPNSDDQVVQPIPSSSIGLATIVDRENEPSNSRLTASRVHQKPQISAQNPSMSQTYAESEPRVEKNNFSTAFESQKQSIPHFQIDPGVQSIHKNVQHPTRRTVGISTHIGQVCAYSGVGLLTCGSIVVIWSFFGGPANNMPAGLLAAAVGQLLLFLGVVTLISSGMEQTISEVTWRIDHLAEEIHHMGQSLDEFENGFRKLSPDYQQSTHHNPDEDRIRKAA